MKNGWKRRQWTESRHPARKLAKTSSLGTGSRQADRTLKKPELLERFLPFEGAGVLRLAENPKLLEASVRHAGRRARAVGACAVRLQRLNRARERLRVDMLNRLLQLSAHLRNLIHLLDCRLMAVQRGLNHLNRSLLALRQLLQTSRVLLLLLKHLLVHLRSLLRLVDQLLDDVLALVKLAGQVRALVALVLKAGALEILVLILIHFELPPCCGRSDARWSALKNRTFFALFRRCDLNNVNTLSAAARFYSLGRSWPNTTFLFQPFARFRDFSSF